MSSSSEPEADDETKNDVKSSSDTDSKESKLKNQNSSGEETASETDEKLNLDENSKTEDTNTVVSSPKPTTLTKSPYIDNSNVDHSNQLDITEQPVKSKTKEQTKSQINILSILIVIALLVIIALLVLNLVITLGLYPGNTLQYSQFPVLKTFINTQIPGSDCVVEPVCSNETLISELQECYSTKTQLTNMWESQKEKYEIDLTKQRNTNTDLQNEINTCQQSLKKERDGSSKMRQQYNGLLATINKDQD